MVNPIISIVILNWNGKRHLKACLDSIYSQTYQNFEILFVDNASTDDSVDFVKKNYSDARILKNNKNYGFAKGNNIGIKKARGKFILILNYDTKLDKNFLNEILKPTNDGRIGMVSSKILLMDKKKVDTIGLKLFVSGLAKDVKNEKEKSLIVAPSGGAVLYRKKMLDDIKQNGEYFDEDYFLYAEDLDLGLRARLRGWNVAYAKNALVLHVHSAAVKKSTSFNQLLGHRNLIWTMIKDFPNSTLLKYCIPILIMQVADILYYFIKLKPILILRIKLSALAGISKMLKKRKLIQGRKKIPPSDFEKLLVKRLI